MKTINGKSGADLIYGTVNADYIDAKGGNDTVYAGGSADVVHGGDGNDTLYGEAGNDTISGDAGNDQIFGGDGNDSLSGGIGDDYIDGGAGNDILRGEAGHDTLIGGDGDDELDISAGNDTMTGGAGADIFGVSSAYGSAATITDFGNGADLLLGYQGWDANAAMAGNQHWEYVGSAAPATALANGDGQASVVYQPDGTTVLQLYNNDGDLNADLTLTFAGTYTPEQLQIMLYDSASGAWTDPGIVYS